MTVKTPQYEVGQSMLLLARQPVNMGAILAWHPRAQHDDEIAKSSPEEGTALQRRVQGAGCAWRGGWPLASTRRAQSRPARSPNRARLAGSLAARFSSASPPSGEGWAWRLHSVTITIILRASEPRPPKMEGEKRDGDVRCVMVNQVVLAARFSRRNQGSVSLPLII
jgi:hypothetical protein